MGRFVYDSNVKVEFEDRLLAHLQAVIMSKVRRGESFTFTWKDDVSTGGGRTSVYIHPSVSMVFKFYGGRTPQLNPAWLQALTYNANLVGVSTSSPSRRELLGRLPRRRSWSSVRSESPTPLRRSASAQAVRCSGSAGVAELMADDAGHARRTWLVTIRPTVTVSSARTAASV